MASRMACPLWLVLPAVALTAVLGSSFFWPGEAVAQEKDAYRTARLKMVEEEIAGQGITNKAVLNAMRQVPRHQFVTTQQRPKAYFDQALPIGHKQTISPPFIVAYMTEIIDPQPSDRVLEIGTGSGYQAAVLSRIVKEVYSIEIVKVLGEQAAKRLQDLGYSNIRTRIGDGYKGWPEQAPFDKILVTCSPEEVPQPLIEQLREGGKMIIPLGERYQQVFYLFEKKDDKLVKTRLVPTLFVPMTGTSEKQRKVRPDPANPRVVNGGFEQETDGRVDVWYYQRQATLSHEKAPEGNTYLTLTNNDPGRGAQVIQGIGLDGTKVALVRISLWVQAENTRVGTNPHEVPAVSIHFYDVDHRPLGDHVMGPWLGTFAWKPDAAAIRVPPQTYEAVVRIGLNGATGRLSVDDIRLSRVR